MIEFGSLICAIYSENMNEMSYLLQFLRKKKYVSNGYLYNLVLVILKCWTQDLKFTNLIIFFANLKHITHEQNIYLMSVLR